MLGRSSSLSFAERKPSPKGFFSVALSAIALCVWVAAILISYKNAGKAGQVVGACGVMAFLSSVMGLGFGIFGIIDGDRRRVWSYIGTAIGAVVLLGLIITFVKGF